MKIMLIAPPIMDDFWGEPRPIAMDAVRECPPYGIYLLAAVLRQAGHEVALVDLIADGSYSLTLYLHELSDCGLVGISATSMSWPTACAVIGQVHRARPDVPIVLGGIHPTMFDRYLLSTFPVDYVVRGEGEIALAALCRAIETGQGIDAVPNLSWKDQSGRICRNPAGPKIWKGGLADFPCPDFSQLPMKLYKGLSIESSRGCAFDCSFCSTSYRRSWRGMSPEAFVDRLEEMLPHVARTEHEMVHVIDDEFSMNPRRAIEITDLLRSRGLHPSLVYDSRATDVIYDGFVAAMAEFTGQFLIGAECGYDEGLKKIGKGTTTEILEQAAALLCRHNLSDRADFSFILGLPWEGADEVHRTCAFAAHLFSTYGVRILLQWYCQIPGSRLWQADRDAGLVNEAMYNTYGFFRDLYLFRTGVKLTPTEIWKVSNTVEAMRVLARLRHPDKEMIEYGHPEPISLYFPEVISGTTSDSLSNLREVASPAKPGLAKPVWFAAAAGAQFSPQRPLRHMTT
jgi:anaerobic magnesium-protoporphyrin IX monomethyl ester cyclase